MEPPACLNVGVLIDHRPNHRREVGGLAGTWHRIAEAAAGRTDIDLTIFFLGDEPAEKRPAGNIREVLVKPALGTERFAFLKSIPTRTDLAPLHPRLYGMLKGFHILHTTDAFHAFAKTALWRSRRRRCPLTTSVQTDIIGWARIYTPEILHRLVRSETVAGLLIERCGLLDRRERAMERQFGSYLRSCSVAFVSHARDRERAGRLAPDTRTVFLRRGIDLNRFHPRHRTPDALRRRFNLPAASLLMLFAGRIDCVKGALIAAAAVKELRAQGLDLHLLMVGDGSRRTEVAGLLGGHVTLTGNLPYDELPGIYAGADMLLFPSEAEVWPNVVAEALACGLPVAACTTGAAHLMRGSGSDGMLISGSDTGLWVRELSGFLASPERLRRMRTGARRTAEQRLPDWNTVIDEDLIPAWRRAARDASFRRS